MNFRLIHKHLSLDTHCFQVLEYYICANMFFISNGFKYSKYTFGTSETYYLKKKKIWNVSYTAVNYFEYL